MGQLLAYITPVSKKIVLNTVVIHYTEFSTIFYAIYRVASDSQGIPVNLEVKSFAVYCESKIRQSSI